MADRGHAAPEGGFTLTAVGDIFLANRTQAEARGDIERALQLLPPADFTYGNLEMAVGETGFAKAKKSLTGRPGVLDDIKAMGFTHVCVANNHFLDLGLDAAVAAVDEIGRRGLGVVGVGRSAEQAVQPLILTTPDNTRVAFLAVFCAAPSRRLLDVDGSRATPDRPGVASIRGYDVAGPGFEEGALWPDTRDIIAIRRAISAAREAAEFVVVTFHWHWLWRWWVEQAGQAVPVDRRTVTPGMRWLAAEAVSAGADCILGHGPHVLGAVGCVKGRPILYSLGNFFFQLRKDGKARPQFWASPSMADDIEEAHWETPDALLTAVAHLTVSPGRPITTRILLGGIRMDVDGCPVSLTREERGRALEALREMSWGLGATFEFENEEKLWVVVHPTREGV